MSYIPTASKKYLRPVLGCICWLKDKESRTVRLKQFLLYMNVKCCKGPLKKASIIICKITVLEDFIKASQSDFIYYF